MKKSEIEKLTVGQFESLLNEENYNYIQEEYQSITRALEVYQEGSEIDTSGDDEYINVNEYFELDREQQENYNSELESRYED